MQIAEHLTRAIARARGMKEQKVTELTAGEHTDINAIIEGFRGDSPVVVLMPAQIDRDESLKAAWIAASAFGCDVIAMTTESWHPAEEYALYNPVSGERASKEKVIAGEEAVPWPAGSMQDVALNHGGLEKGWIVESLNTVVVNRAGDMASGIQDYKINRSTNALGITKSSIEWLGEPQILETSTEGVKLGGIIPVNMVRFMNEPSIDVAISHSGLSGADFGLTPVQTQAHTDCAAVKYLLSRVGYAGAVMLTSDNPERTAVLDSSLGNHPDLIWKDDPR